MLFARSILFSEILYITPLADNLEWYSHAASAIFIFHFHWSVRHRVRIIIDARTLCFFILYSMAARVNSTDVIRRRYFLFISILLIRCPMSPFATSLWFYSYAMSFCKFHFNWFIHISFLSFKFKFLLLFFIRFNNIRASRKRDK